MSYKSARLEHAEPGEPPLRCPKGHETAVRLVQTIGNVKQYFCQICSRMWEITKPF